MSLYTVSLTILEFVGMVLNAINLSVSVKAKGLPILNLVIVVKDLAGNLPTIHMPAIILLRVNLLGFQQSLLASICRL